MKTAEEILGSFLENYPWQHNGKQNAIKAMEEYASQFKPLSKVGEVTNEQIDAMILDYLPDTLAVSNGFEKKLARLKMKLALKELRSLFQPSSVDKVVGDEEIFLKGAKYGYEYHQTTQFPSSKFEDECINNSKQEFRSLSVRAEEKESKRGKDVYIHNKEMIGVEWLELWDEIEKWYGDVQKKESGKDFLLRMQNTYFTDTFVSPSASDEQENSEGKKEKHECKYCGVMTTQPDSECYAKPVEQGEAKEPTDGDLRKVLIFFYQRFKGTVDHKMEQPIFQEAFNSIRSLFRSSEVKEQELTVSKIADVVEDVFNKKRIATAGQHHIYNEIARRILSLQVKSNEQTKTV